MEKIKEIKFVKLDTQEITSFSVNITAEQRIQLFNIGYHTVTEMFEPTKVQPTSETVAGEGKMKS